MQCDFSEKGFRVAGGRGRREDKGNGEYDILLAKAKEIAAAQGFGDMVSK